MIDKTKQNERRKRYEKKAGFQSKSYKLRTETVERFAAACELAGVSQAGQITKMMNEFSEKIERNDKA